MSDGNRQHVEPVRVRAIETGLGPPNEHLEHGQSDQASIWLRQPSPLPSFGGIPSRCMALTKSPAAM